VREATRPRRALPRDRPDSGADNGVDGSHLIASHRREDHQRPAV